MPPVDQASL